MLEAWFADSARLGATAAGFPASSPATATAWRSVYGRDPVLAWQRALNEAVAEVIDVAASEGIDAGIVKGGTMRVAP